MDTDIYRIEYNHVEPCRGCVLIAEPFLRDQFFGRSVIFVVEHSVESGTMGLVLNKPLPVMLADIMCDCQSTEDIPVYRAFGYGYLVLSAHLGRCTRLSACD